MPSLKVDFQDGILFILSCQRIKVKRTPDGVLFVGPSVHKGFTQNTSKTGFKHSILHSYFCLNRVKRKDKYYEN